MAIYFYVPRDEWGWLSNFSPHGVELDGAWWPTVEHYFQAAKFVETDPAYAAMIRGVSKPKDAARLGRDRGHPLRPDWEAVKEDVMRRAVRCKLETHPELREKILATGAASGGSARSAVRVSMRMWPRRFCPDPSWPAPQ